MKMCIRCMLRDPNCSIAECVGKRGLGLWILRKLFLCMNEYNSWLELVESLQGVTLDHDSADSVSVYGH